MREPGLGTHGGTGAGTTSSVGFRAAWRAVTLVTAAGVAAFFVVALVEGASPDSALESAVQGFTIAAIGTGSFAGVLVGGRRAFAAAGVPDSDHLVPREAPEALRSLIDRVARSRRVAAAGVLASGLVLGLVAYQASDGRSSSAGDDVALDRVRGAEVARNFDEPSLRGAGGPSSDSLSDGRAGDDRRDDASDPDRDDARGSDDDSNHSTDSTSDDNDDANNDDDSDDSNDDDSSDLPPTTTTTVPEGDDDPGNEVCDAVDDTEDTLSGDSGLVGGLLGEDVSEKCEEVSDPLDDTVDEVEETVDDTVDDLDEAVGETDDTLDDTVDGLEDDVDDTLTSTTLPSLGL